MAVNIVTRQTGSYAKNSTLTNTELDTNFINLKDAVDNVTVNIENTKSSIRPSLLLDFSNLKRLDKRITFTRASIGTRYNADGLLERVEAGKPRFDHDPVTRESLGLLIEEQRQNLLPYSEQFDSAVWVLWHTFISQNIAIAPDGTYSAKLLAETTTNSEHYLDYIGPSIISGTTYTMSVYAKNAGAKFIRLRTALSNPDLDYIVDLETGALAAGTQTYLINPSVIPVGNGWYRISASYTGTLTRTGLFRIQLVTGANPQSVYAGDGKSGVYIWGAQLEVGAFATSYIPSNDTFTSRASTATYIGSDGLVKTSAINTARYNYNPMNLKLAPKLLLEPAATNLVTYSEQFDNAVWVKYNSAITANATTAPDGTFTADKLVENNTTNRHLAYTGATIASTAITFSVYVKAGERTEFNIDSYEGITPSNPFISKFNLSTLVATKQNASTADATITAVGNGWYRCSVTTITAPLVATSFYIILSNGSTTNYAGDGTSGIYIWGAQLEAGTTATSYIPTTSSQVTRSADVSSSGQYTRLADSAVMAGTNFLNWYRQDQGTLHATSRLMSTTTAVSVPTIAWVDTAAGGAFISLRYVSSSGSAVIDSYGFNNSVSQWDLNGTAVTSQTVISCAVAYATNDIALSVSGSTTETDTSAVVGQGMSRMLIGPTQNLHILKLAYYPKRLSNAELQSLTGG
jgi:hypothetical protein